MVLLFETQMLTYFVILYKCAIKVAFLLQTMLAIDLQMQCHTESNMLKMPGAFSLRAQYHC